MPGNKYNSNSSHIPNRLERLLRDRELRKNKNSRASHLNEANDNNRVILPPEHELHSREDENSKNLYVEKYLEGAAAAMALNEGCEKQEARPLRQRLLVVANRLPVSAVRRGEHSWSLEMSAGGLVSALLGM